MPTLSTRFTARFPAPRPSRRGAPLLALLLLAGAALPSAAMAQAVAPAAGAPAATLPTIAEPLQTVGQGRMTWFGFELYDARLDATREFRAAEYQRYPFRLELTYLRNFTAQAIAERSLVEMKRVGRIDDATAARWEQALRQAIPDVRKGDSITGLHLPGVGAVFLSNGRPFGEVRDPEFARLFFGIWLAPQTSAPSLREALVARAGG